MSTKNLRLRTVTQSATTGALMIAMAVLAGSSLSPLSMKPISADAERGIRSTIGSMEELKAALHERTELLKATTLVSFVPTSGTAVTTLNVAALDHQDWVKFEPDALGKTHPIVDERLVYRFLEETPITELGSPISCDIRREWVDAQGVGRIETSCTAEQGYSYDKEDSAMLIKKALESGAKELNIEVTEHPAVITGTNESGAIVSGTLELLATGQSNFKGSGEGRKSNVRKALNEHVNNIVIPEGATFSFNSALGGKVSLASGWKMALTIFNGKDLIPSPGGGICQASTTLYRAALKAGLPIIAQKSHSLFVTYYEKYGVGLDATVFPGQQDMTFKNDTPGPLVIQSYSKGDEAVVHIFGIDDHRSVTLSGPYFTSTAPEHILIDGRTIRKNEIAWQREVRLPNGERKDEIFSARYMAIPKSLAKRSPATTLQARGETTENIAMHAMVAENR